jgi:hypothetical protein
LQYVDFDTLEYRDAVERFVEAVDLIRLLRQFTGIETVGQCKPTRMLSKRSERDSFRALAGGLRVPFLILAFNAPLAMLRERVAQRLERGSDASEADVTVLEHQLNFQEALDEHEKANAIRVDTRTSVPPAFWKNLFSKINSEP